MTTTETLLNALKANIDSIQTTLSVAEKERFVEHLQKIHDAGSYDKAEQSVSDFVDFCLKIPLLGDILEKADVRYYFPVNLLRKWVFKRHPLRQVRETL